MYRKYLKRLFGLLTGIILLIVLMPLLLFITIVLFIRDGKRVFFIQERVGRGCRKFNVIKFRTMLETTDTEGNLLADEERITSFGKFLRKYSLDELPQLINIIKGDMSLVGPRPFMERYVANCTEQQLRRHEVRPGVTGLAQVCGRNSVSYENRFRYDVWYVNNYSFMVDMRILYLTAKMVLGVDNEKNVIEYDPLMEDKYRANGNGIEKMGGS